MKITLDGMDFITGRKMGLWFGDGGSMYTNNKERLSTMVDRAGDKASVYTYGEIDVFNVAYKR